MLKRKIDSYLLNRKNKTNKKPLLISGCRQIGKTTSIQNFGKTYTSFIEINFFTNPEFKNIFKNGFNIDSIIKEISLLNNEVDFIENDTLIFFDEIQVFPDALTSFKFFSLDNRFDVIASGSLLGINYNDISSIPVGFKEEYEMKSMDFEEFLWALNYKEEHINELKYNMFNLKPFSDAILNKFNELFREYIFIGGMPEVVDSFIKNKTYKEPFLIQKRIYKDFEDDIKKYAVGLEKAKIKNMYLHLSSQLAKDNHKFQVTKLGHGARSRDYVGCEEWLKDSGIINISYNLSELKIPFSSYINEDYFRLYFADHSIFIASLDEESKKDLIENNNYSINNGALYESLISEALIKQGIEPNFYKNEDSTIELDFIIRSKNEIIPIEVKKGSSRAKSLNSLINSKSNINYGIKVGSFNIGFNNNIFTFPLFLSFLIKDFFDNTNFIKR